jgi:RsiW-degrading membrane proteinase PrsW (M82 family)
MLGWILYALGMLGGGLLLVLVFLVPPLFGDDPGTEYTAMAIGAVLALPPLFIYLWMPWFVDRYDPEPWWALLFCLSWGAIAACGFAAVINTGVHAFGQAVGGPAFGEALGACVSAPITEELFKGLAVAGIYFFVRREFDGVVDGVIYATFAALGFAATENIIYYGNAAQHDLQGSRENVLAATFLMRGILAPWGHPLYTSMTGLGFGIARETEKTWLKWLAPLGGYCFAAFLHSVWNTSATISGMLTALMLPLWFLFILCFFGLVIWLVARKGKIIREHLKDEVLMGFLTFSELEMISSPFGRWKATLSWGGTAGRKFIDVATRLSLSKWHAGRAHRNRKLTVSADMVVPLRQELAQLRAEVSRYLRRPVPQPVPYQPGAPLPAWFRMK